MKLKLNAEQRNEFEKYRMNVSLPVVRAFSIVVILFNLFLLIPDIINLSGLAVLIVIIARVVFSVVLVFLFIWLKRIKTFAALAGVMTAAEAIGIIQFLYVFHLYPNPSFMIQLLGLMILIILIFLVPNRWGNMLITAIAGTAVFLWFAYDKFASGHLVELIAGTVYLSIEIALCAVFARFFQGYQLRECMARAELERACETDPLTRIGNRNMLADERKEWVQSLGEQGRPFSLVLMDVDNLKQINDSFGHVVGDAILMVVAQITRTHLCKNDICIRWGGDEFLLLLPDAAMSEAVRLTERIRQAISGHAFGSGLSPTCSFGIAEIKKGQSFDALIAEADASMYAAKNSGRNAIVAGEDIMTDSCS